MVAIGAQHPREALVEIPAGEESLHGLGGWRPKPPVALLIALGIDSLDLVEVRGENLMQGRVARPTRMAEAGGDGADHDQIRGKTGGCAYG